MIDEPIYQLRGQLNNWSYTVRLEDIIIRLKELIELNDKPHHKMALEFILEQLESLT